MDDRVLKILGYDKIKEMLADCAISERGAAAARALLPATERQEAERLMAQTKEAESISISNAAHPMMGFDEFERGTDAPQSRSRAFLRRAAAGFPADEGGQAGEKGDYQR